nr:MAG TPA: hypothetical protein [Caudoviricetes sp.]
MCTSSRVHDTSCLFLIKPLVGNTSIGDKVY